MFCNLFIWGYLFQVISDASHLLTSFLANHYPQFILSFTRRNYIPLGDFGLSEAINNEIHRSFIQTYFKIKKPISKTNLFQKDGSNALVCHNLSQGRGQNLTQVPQNLMKGFNVENVTLTS